MQEGETVKMSTTEEGPEAGTDEVTTKVSWLTLNFPQGLLEPELTTTCCCLQGSPGALWVHVVAVEGSCSGALGRALRANAENSLVGTVKGVLLVWWLGGYPLRPSILPPETVFLCGASHRPTGFLGGGPTMLETTFLQRAKPVAAASSPNYHL